MNGWTQGKVEKAQRLLPRIMTTVAEALEVEASDLWELWAEGTVPAFAAPSKAALQIEATIAPAKPAAAPELEIRRPKPHAPSTKAIDWSERDGRLRRIAGTMPAAAVAADLGIGVSALYARAAKLDISLAFRRKPAPPVAASGAAASPPSAPKVEAPAPAVEPPPPVPSSPPRAAETGAHPIRLVDRLGRYLRRDGDGVTRRSDEAWEGTQEKLAIVRRRNPRLRHFKEEAAV